MDILTCNKQGRQSVIVDRIGYDKEGHMVYTKLGNGTETTYTYDKQRERLQVMNLTADGQTVMENRYQYDAVDNILGITNAANPTSLTKLNKAKLGGKSSHTYEYDELNRLVHASGKAKCASYDMVMSFGRMSEPLTKVQKVDSTTAKSYNFAYKYEDSNHPTAPTQIGHDHYTYDANGNPILVENDSLNTERIVKSHGDLEGVYINGAPQGISFHETEDYTIYPAPIITVTKNRFTKHYFIGDKRVASKLGVGKFSNVYGIGGNNVTAGQKDYAARMMQIEKQREEYYKQLGTPPGVPTMKGATADPDNTGIGYNSIITDLGDHSVPEGWIQHPKFNGKGDVPGPPIQWSEPESPDNAQPGYGYIPTDTTNTEDIFFYHSDHLGSTSYITDAKANITQFDAYLPYGELLVDEHTSSEDMPYKFNGKEFDEETGLYYYGARYMNPVSSLWYGVDAFTEKYPSISGYVYCVGKPIKFVDPDGNKIVFVNGKIGFGSPPAGEQYWNGRKSSFVQGAIKYWNDKEIFFTDKDYKPLSSAKSRISAGYRYAEDNIKKIVSGLKQGETFKFVTHSMGAAFAEGIASYLIGHGYSVEEIVHINPFQAADITTNASPNVKTVDYQNSDDWVINKTPFVSSPGDIQNADYHIREKSNDSDFATRHRSPIDSQGKSFWNNLLKRTKGPIIDSSVNLPNLNISSAILFKSKR